MGTRIVEEKAHTIESIKPVECSSEAAEITRPDDKPCASEDFRILFEAIEQGMVISEIILNSTGEAVDCRILEANAQFEPITGLSREKFLSGKTVRELIPTIEDSWVKRLGGVAVTGEPFRYENYIPVLDRRLAVHSFRIGDPTLRRVACLFRDGSEQRYRSLFNSIDQGYAVAEVLYDGNGVPTDVRFIETNDVFKRQTGLTNHLGQTAREVIPNFDDNWPKIYAHVAETGESVRFEKRSKGLGRWFNVFVSRVGGEGSRLVNIIKEDVTAQKEADAALRESEERFRRFLENVREYAFVQVDTGLRMTSWNPGAERIFGYSSREALGQPFSTLLAPEDRATEVPFNELSKIEGGSRSEDARWLIRKDGTRIWTRWVSEPIHDKDGQITGMTMVLRDETECLKTETSLRQSEKLAVVGRMASSIAHEINNPLEAVTNLIFLARRGEISSEVAELLTQTERELARVNHIAKATLHFHRQTLVPVQADIETILESVLLLHEGRLRASRITIERRYGMHPSITCQENEIQQVLANLVGNAIDAMTKSPDLRRLTVRVRKAVNSKTGEEGVRVMIGDTGMGIPESAVKHIFEPFFTTKATTGTGLGLWISAETVKKHQGTLRFRSRTVGAFRGTVFSLYLGSRENVKSRE